jgi:hypothetical protein
VTFGAGCPAASAAAISDHPALEHLSASKEHRMAYPSERNNVIRNYT